MREYVAIAYSVSGSDPGSTTAPRRSRARADRSARVGAERGMALAGGDRRARAARRPAGDATSIPRVPRRAERRVLGGRSHRELVAVELADDDGAGALETRGHGGVVRG